MYTKVEVNDLIKKGEDRSDRSAKLFDKALDRSALDGTRPEDRLNERAKDFEIFYEKNLTSTKSYIDTKKGRRANGVVEEIPAVSSAESNIHKASNTTVKIGKALKNEKRSGPVGAFFVFTKRHA